MTPRVELVVDGLIRALLVALLHLTLMLFSQNGVLVVVAVVVGAGVPVVEVEVLPCFVAQRLVHNPVVRRVV